MTHFVGAVIVPANTDTELYSHERESFGHTYTDTQGTTELQEFLENVLDKYSENKETPRYVKYTKEEAIAAQRAEDQEYAAGNYAEYQKDPAAYEASMGYANEAHITYLRDTFPPYLTQSDDEVYARMIRWEEPEDLGPNGEVYSEYNPNSKWDWWVIGGRWAEVVAPFQAETVEQLAGRVQSYLNLTAEEREADKGWDNWVPNDLILPTEPGKDFATTDDESINSEWFADGKHLWFGMKDTKVDAEAWPTAVLDRLSSVPQDSKVIYIDFHI